MPSLKARSPRISRQPQVVSVSDLTGGLDLRRSPTLLDSARSRTNQNFSLEEIGGLVVRPAFQLASTAAIFSGAPQGGARVYLKNTVFTLLAGGGAIYNPDDAWASTGSVYSTISSSNAVYFPYDRDLVMCMDGANRPVLSTDGTTWLLSGIDAPSSAASLSTGSSGALSSGTEYAFAYTYKHTGTQHESNGSAESTITPGSTGSITVTCSPSTDAKVDAFVLYARNKTAGESVLRKVSSQSGSTFIVTSSAWTANDEIPTNHNVPVVGLRFAVPWKSRWWAPSGTVGNRLYFTELFLPQAWPALFFIDIPFEKGDSITALEPLGDTLIVYGQSGAFVIIGQTALDFEVRPHAGMEAGAFGARSTARVEQTVIHSSADGVHSFDGAGDRNLFFDLQTAQRDLVENVASTTLERTSVVYDALRKELRRSSPRVYPTGAGGEWILNLDRTREAEGVPAWTTTNRDVGLYIPWDGNEPTAGDRGRLFIVASTSGTVFEDNVGSGANGSNVTATYEGPGLHFGLHRARFTGVHVEYEPHGGDASVEAVVDGVSQGVIPLSISGGLFTYGSTLATYGTATYGSAARRKAYTPLPISASGRSAAITLSYVGTERMKFYGYSVDVVPEPRPRQLGY